MIVVRAGAGDELQRTGTTRCSRSSSLADVVGDGEPLATEHGADHLDLVESDRCSIKRVFVDDGEVGDLADFDRAQVILLAPRVRGIDRDGSQRLLNGQPLLGCSDATGLRDAVDRTRHHADRIAATHRQVGVKGQRHTALQHRPIARHQVGTLRAEADLAELVSESDGVVRVRTDDAPERSDAIDLFFS